MRSRILLTAALATGALSAVAPPASAQDKAVWCVDGASVAAGSLPSSYAASVCAVDHLTVTDGLASVPMPARGNGVAAHVLRIRGEDALSVTRDAAGRVTIRRGSAVPAGPRLAASACSSAAFVDLGYKISGTYSWGYNGAGAPANVAGRAAALITAATGNIVNGRDDCGVAGKPRTAARYTGPTSIAPGLTSTAQCGANDGRNVTGWKSLSASGVLAVTCTYTRGGSVAASDAAINTRFRWATSPAGCSGAYDLKGVMTHERGHTFGLGHATGDSGLTMYPSVRACDFTKSTLGKGDVLGLFSIYGKA